MEKRDILAEIKEKANSVIIKEFTMDGALIEYNSSGEVKGKIHGTHLETADVKMKMDGTNEWEMRAIETTKEGDVLMITGKGTGRQNNFIGELTYVTNSLRLSWLNNTKARVEGTTDMKSNEATLRVWQEKPAPSPAPEAQPTVPMQTPAAPQTPAPTETPAQTETPAPTT